MSFPRYESYKDSGVEWLGEVPAHWLIAAIKWEFRVVSGSTPRSDNQAYWDGEVVWVTPADLGKVTQFEIFDSLRKITTKGLASCGATLAPTGSLVLSTRAPIGSLAITVSELCTNQGCKALIPSNHINIRFYAYLFSVAREELNIRGKGTTFLELSVDELRSFKTCFPPLDEQRIISAFLDYETAKIDALITEQWRLIELLKEKRQAVISHAVTKGLNPDVPMKDSGIEWLGEVPAHWGIQPIKYVIAKIESGTSVNATDTPAENDDVGVLKTSCVYSGRFIPSENKTVIEQEIDRLSCPLKGGTLIVSRMNTPDLVGAAGLVTEAPANLYLPDRLWQISFLGVNPSYVHYWTQSNFYKGIIKTACSGTSSSMQNLSQDQFKSFSLPIPTQEEQSEIVTYLDHETIKIDLLVSEAEKAIILLQERRTALISAAVTGKIDVRGITQ